MAAIARAGPGQRQVPGIQAGSHKWAAGTQALQRSLAASQVVRWLEAGTGVEPKLDPRPLMW